VFFAPYFHPVLGRPSTSVECYLRLMFLKFRYRLGYESLCAEVSDSISWRRFCRIGLDGPVPHPTTLMKLTSRCGPEVVARLNEALWARAAGQKVLRTIAYAHRSGNHRARIQASFGLAATFHQLPIPADTAIRRVEELLQEASGEQSAEAHLLTPLSLLYAYAGRFADARGGGALPVNAHRRRRQARPDPQRRSGRSHRAGRRRPGRGRALLAGRV
jgi:hypothetical protein